MSDYFTCPGCDRLIKNEMLNNNCCPHCGLSYDDKEKIEDLKKGYICPKCGDVYNNVNYRNDSGKCRYCNVALVKTDINTKDLYNITCVDYIESKTMARAAANHYGNFTKITMSIITTSNLPILSFNKYKENYHSKQNWIYYVIWCIF